MIKINLLKNRALQNAGWLIAGKILQMIISLFVGTITARYLGPANYGLISYASAYISFFTPISTLGINSLLVKEFVDNPDEEGKVIGTSLVLKTFSTLLSSAIIIGIVFIVDYGEPTTIAVVAISCIGLVFHVFETLIFWFQRHLRSKVTAIVSLIGYGATALYRIILLILNKSVHYFAFALTVDYIVIAVLLLLSYKKYNGSKFSFSLSYAKNLLGRSCHFILSSLMVAIYGQTDKFMLKQMLGESDVGFYSIALTVCGLWSFVLTAIIDSLQPSIMTASNNDEELFKKRNRQLYAIVFYLSMFVSLVITLLAPLIIWILYGKAYFPSITPLRIITWYTAFSYLGVARNAWIVCKNKQRYLIYIYALAAISNVLLNLVLIPTMGTAGAAIASLIAQILTSIILPLFIKDFRENAYLMIDAILLRKIK